MKRTTEIDLAKELLGLHANKSAFLDEAVSSNSVQHYLDPDRFALERDRILRTSVLPAVHSSELSEPNAFLRRTVAGLPVLFTRDGEGVAHAFLNVCRHRGTRLVGDEQGCRVRFTCPYHAWTWNNRGELLAAPHAEEGFPDLNREAFGLKRLGCSERYGWIWIDPATDDPPDVDTALAGLGEDFDWFGAGRHQVLHTEQQVRSVNWKILVEGGLEAYHFRVAHKNTIGPYFADNLSTYQCFGAHLRSILARRSLTDLEAAPEETWRLRDHAQVLYTVFPNNSLLVQSDHIAWIQMEPMTVSSTHVRIHTLVPTDRVDDETDLAHWAKNHKITVDTLNEDFDIGESIQAGLATGANEQLHFGRFEGALAVFNQQVERAL